MLAKASGFMMGASVVPLVGTTWNPSDKDAGITLSNGNLTAICAGATNSGVRGIRGWSTGKRCFWFNCNFNGSDRFAGIGVATASASLVFASTGATFYYTVNGNKYIAGTASGYGSAWQDHTVNIRVEVNLDAQTIEFFRNNVSQGSFSHGLGSGALYPFLCMPSDVNDGGTANFGPSGPDTPTAGFDSGWSN